MSVYSILRYSHPAYFCRDTCPIGHLIKVLTEGYLLEAASMGDDPGGTRGHSPNILEIAH